MKIGGSTSSNYHSSSTNSISPKNVARNFASDMAESNRARADSSTDDFTNMTGSRFLEVGKELAAEGKISLDQMFQIQLASGSFGSTQSDTSSKDFVKYFRQQLDGEISRGGLNNAKSMVGTYQGLLSTMGAADLQRR